MTRWTVYNPAAPEGAEAPVGASRLKKAFRGSRALIVDGGKHNAKEAMLHIIDQLSTLYGVTNLGCVSSPHGRLPDEDVLDELARKCDWVLVGSAD